MSSDDPSRPPLSHPAPQLHGCLQPLATSSGLSTPPEHRTGCRDVLKAPTLFLLDEFAVLGRLEAVERAMGLMAGYCLQLWPILQDMNQLKDL